MRGKYILSEAALGLWRNVTMTVAMIITMMVSLTMIGASGLLFLQVDQVRDRYYAQVEVSIFLSEDITEEQRAAIDRALASDPLVATYFFETREMALDRARSMFAEEPEIQELLRPEVLPESFRITLVNPEQFDEIALRYRDMEGVSDIHDQGPVVQQVFRILNAMRIASMIGGGIMAIAALLLVANVIQVAAYSKRREVAVMKMVGASNWFIQLPFVLEAAVAGLIGALLAFGALVAGKALLIDGPLSPLTAILTPVPWRNVLLTLPALAVVGGGVSAITGWVTLRFYLPR